MVIRKKKLTKYEKLIRIIIIALAVILFWRGIWGVADVLLFPDNYLLSSCISIILGIIILFAVHGSFEDLF